MDTLRDSLKSPETKKKILFSFLIVSVLCLLTIVPIPGLVHSAAMAKIEGWGSTGTVLDILTCGALSNASITSLGIYPFLIASIVVQIVAICVPKLRQLSELGDEGTKIISKLTRIAALIGSVVYAVLFCVGMRDAVVPTINFWVAIILCGVSVAVGSAFCGWCVELLNKKGIGNGLTIIILAGVIHNVPRDLLTPFFDASVLGVVPALLYMIAGILCMIGMLILVLVVNMGEKKLRILFQKRTVGMRQYGMPNQVLPLKVAQAGVTPIIYAMAFATLISVIVAMVAPGSENYWLKGFINFPTSVLFIFVYIILLVFFTTIFTMMQFNPMDMSNQLKQNGGYIQGLRPGKQTSQYLLNLSSNLNSFDCFYMIFVCIIPMALHFIPALNNIAFCGVGLIILGGGFIEIKTLLDNDLKAQEEKAKQAGKEKKRKGYNK